MKVLIINACIGSGSVGRIVSDLYYGITKSGHKCKVAYARGGISDLPIEDTFKICSTAQIYIHALLSRLFGNTAFYFKGTTRKLCKWIKDYSPDIIHLHGVYGYYINMDELFGFLSKRESVVISTLHSCWDFTGHCCYFDFIGCDQWKKGCTHCKSTHSYPKSFFGDNTARNFQKKKRAYNSLKKCVIVSPSKWLANLAAESFLNKHKILVINNGIDLESFKPSPLSILIDSTKPSILCIANKWEKRKGWNDVVKLSKYLDESVQLIVVGASKKQQKLLNKKTITIKRTNSKKELASLYANATVLFNPTYEDNYPTVNLESIACHTPVITYQTGGSPEVLINHEWGRVIDKCDFDNLLRLVKFYFLNKATIDFSSLSLLSNSVMIKRYMSLYESELNSHMQL